MRRPGSGGGGTSPGGGAQDAPASPVGQADETATGGARAQTTDANAASTVDPGITGITFYPRRLPVLVGREAQLTVVLDPGYAGATAPLHFAYDPARLDVTDVVGGDLPTASGNVHVSVTHSPSVGWITVSWDGSATGSGTLMTVSVRPRASGELPIVFAGPVGAAVVAQPATVLGLQGEAPAGATEEQP